MRREAGVYRAWQPGRADGQALPRLAGRPDGLRRTDRRDGAVRRGGRHRGGERRRGRRRRHHQRHRAQRRASARGGSGSWRAHAKPGTIIAIHSTISHTTAVELAQELKPQGIHIADAPVSGGAEAAAKGELAVMVGADDETFERIKEPFSQWASVVIHAGEPGDGTKMKLARNMLTFIIYSAVGESQKLADEAGLNLNDLAKVVRHSDALTGGASSIMYRSDSKPLAPDHFLYQPFLHTRALGEKDLSLALELGEALSVDLPFTRLALEKLRPILVCRIPTPKHRRRGDGRTTPQGPRKNERGLRLGDAQHRGRRVLRPHRRSLVRHDLEPAGACRCATSAS